MLSNKKQTIQFGGKGTARRKNYNFKSVNDNIKTEFLQKIETINKKILSLTDENYTKFGAELNSYITDFIKNIVKDDMSNGSYYNIQNDGLPFLIKTFLRGHNG